MEGYDTKLIHVEGKQSHEMHYSTLPGGKYVFHVLARGRDNSFQSEMSASFNKPKTLAEETWMRALILVVGGGLLIRFTYLYTKKRNEKKLAEAEARRKLEEEFTERTILMMSNTIDARDQDTNGHSRRVAQYTVEIGKQEGLPVDELRELYYAALRHWQNSHSG